MESINDLMPLTHDWNKERLDTLKKLFPDLFTNEGKLNENELKKLIDPESVKETERYEFRWFGKSQAKRNAFTPSNVTLVYDQERSVNPDKTENIIIEGENLEVLKILSAGYRESVKCIYIDPPYNTGKDFVYSDNYTEDKPRYWEQTGVTQNGVRIDTNSSADGRYHSNWLNMMYSRLLIARQLLKPDGVIFISIDDNEVHNLRKLCDEVFGEENFVENFIWRSRLGKGSTSKETARLHEYILCYGKNIELLNFKADLRVSEKDSRERIRQWGQGDSRDDRPTMYYGVISEEFGEVFPIKPDGSDGRWRIGKTEFANLQGKGLVIFEKQEDGRIEAYKIIPKGTETETAQDSILDSEKVKTTAHGSIELSELFNSRVFDYPKPKTLIKHLLEIVDDDNSIVLDFFSGSGVTGQAVMELNQKSNRKFILVQIPEATDEQSEAYKAGYKKISDITIERNRRVVERIIAEKKKEHPDLFKENNGNDELQGLGFKVFKLKKSNFPRVEFAPDPAKTDEENIAALKEYIAKKEAQLYLQFNRDELLTEILLKNGYTLNYQTKKREEFTHNEILHVTDGNKETLICLDEWLEMETVDYFKTHTEENFICLERALDTTRKWNLNHHLGDKFNAF
jgi:adenine-specific DNA-methyltransferase